MLARSQQSPVIAQRPIAPLRPVQSEEKRAVPMEMISVTDAGAESVTIDEDTNEISTPVHVQFQLKRWLTEPVNQDENCKFRICASTNLQNVLRT